MPFDKNTLTHSAGLIYGAEFHHLDHLAPLCAMLQIPLVLTEEKIVSQAKTFYPDLEILHWDSREVPEKVVSAFDTIFYSTPRVLFDEIFFFAQQLHNKRIRTIWCPHGNSDKGRNSPFMEALKEEEFLLVYGPRMEAFLKEKGVFALTKQIGNYRLAYFEKHRAFYENLLPLKSQKPTILYAPTWQDQESNSSFPKMWEMLLNAPKSFTLWVKLHPHLYLQFPEEIKKLKKEKVCLIEDFPSIYPLLARVDLYIGDMSSIGYDFLAFQKPMLLLSQCELQTVGRFVQPDEYSKLFTICEEELGKIIAPNALYKETFSENASV